MDESLKPVIRRMRTERCPRRVLEEVEQAVAREGASGLGQSWLRVGIAATAVVVLVCALVLRSRQGDPLETARTTDPSETVPRKAVQEAFASLASIGLVLQEAGTRSGTRIVEETLPLVRQGFETTRNAIKPEKKI